MIDRLFSGGLVMYGYGQCCMIIYVVGLHSPKSSWLNGDVDGMAPSPDHEILILNSGVFFPMECAHITTYPLACLTAPGA